MKIRAGQPGMGLVHIGGPDCVPDFETPALADREGGSRVNDPAV